MSALDNLFGLRRLLVDGAPALDPQGREIFAQTFNLIGGWTVAFGVDADGKRTVELTPPASVGSGGSADWKDSVRVATTAALAASTRVGNVRTANANGALPSIDGVALSVGDDLLDKDHATGADRGVWRVTSLGGGASPWVLTRRSDFNSSAEVTGGLRVPVVEGTANGGKVWKLTTPDPITLNTTALAFSVDTAASVTAGNGLQGTSVFSVKPNGATIDVSASGVKIATSGVTSTELAANACTTTAIADANVTYAKIQNVSAASRVLGRGSASGAGVCQELTCGVGVRINATQIELSAALAPLATLGTAAQQPRVNAAASAIEYFTPDSFSLGTDLGDASVTIDIGQGAVRVMRAATITAARTITLGTTGTLRIGMNIQLVIKAQGFDVAIVNGGPLGGIIYETATSSGKSVIAGESAIINVEWDGVNWAPAGQAPGN